MEFAERGFQLQSATANEAGRGIAFAFETDIRVEGKYLGGFADELFIDQDYAGHHQRLRLRAGVRQPAVDEQFVDALALQRRHTTAKPRVAAALHSNLTTRTLQHRPGGIVDVQLGGAFAAQPDQHTRSIYPEEGVYFARHVHGIGTLQTLQRLHKKYPVVGIPLCPAVTMDAFSLKNELLLH